MSLGKALSPHPALRHATKLFELGQATDEPELGKMGHSVPSRSKEA